MKLLKKLVVVGVLASSYMTNPDMDKFTDYYMSHSTSAYSELSDEAVEEDTQRDNYYLCSVYTLGDHKYVGAFNRFIELK